MPSNRLCLFQNACKQGSSTFYYLTWHSAIMEEPTTNQCQWFSQNLTWPHRLAPPCWTPTRSAKKDAWLLTTSMLEVTRDTTQFSSYSALGPLATLPSNTVTGIEKMRSPDYCEPGGEHGSPTLSLLVSYFNIMWDCVVITAHEVDWSSNPYPSTCPPRAQVTTMYKILRKIQGDPKKMHHSVFPLRDFDLFKLWKP